MPKLWILLLMIGGLLFAQDRKTPKDDEDPEEDSIQQLAKVRRVYVDLISGGEVAMRLRDLLISSLQSTHLFILTEIEERADAILKGSGKDDIYTDKHSSSDNLTAHSNVSTQLTTRNPNAPGASNTTHGAIGMAIGESESEHTEERQHEALATMRLVNRDGDVIWSTTQESGGGKFLGASADVADKVAKKLSADVKKARREAAK
jgi:hypothetical protein